MKIGLSEEAIRDIVRGFTQNPKDFLNGVRREQEWYTNNFAHGGAWDHRFRGVKDAGLRHNLLVLARRRGIWNFVMLLGNDGNLYVFSKEKNIEKVIKDFGKKSIHYFHAFVALNKQPVEFETQMEFFSKLTDDYEDKRIQEAQKILEQDYSSVKQVVFVISKNEGNEVTSVQAKLYTPYFELVDKLDWTSYTSEEQYEDLLTAFEETDETEEDIDNHEEIDTIPKVKKEVKDRKKQFDEQIPSKKSYKDENKEEDQS